MDKAKEILRKWVIEVTPSTEEILKEVSEAIRSAEVVGYGPEELPAGPEIEGTGSIIVVEGRADVINLLKCGIKNAIGLEGTKVPQSIIQLCKNKEVTAFLDGDRGGDLILKELMQVAEIDYVARAPQGKEVEELTPKELLKALREKVPIEHLGVERIPPPRPSVPDEVVATARQLRGTLEAVIFDESGKPITRIPVSELAEKISQIEGTNTLVFDGVVTQRLIDLAENRNIKLVIGDRISEIAKRPMNLKIMTMNELLGQ